MQIQQSPSFRMTETKYLPLHQSFSSQHISQSKNNESPINDSKVNQQPLMMEGSAISMQVSLEYSSCEPLQIQCYNCHTYSESVVILEQTRYTMIAAVMLFFFCLCWVPFVFKKYFQRIYHLCPGCDRMIGESNKMANFLKRNRLDCF